MARWRRVLDSERAELGAVVSVGEVARAFGISPSAVRYHCLTGNLAARQTLGGGWIISWASARAVLGVPVCEVDREVW